MLRGNCDFFYDFYLISPADAGIQCFVTKMDPSLRGDDNRKSQQFPIFRKLSNKNKQL